MADVTDWSELSDSERKLVDVMVDMTEMFSHMEADRVILFMAFLTDGVVNTLADRVLAARQMGTSDLLDAKTHLAGMALATAMGEYRQAYEVCFHPEMLAEVEKYMEASLEVVDALYAEGLTLEGIQRLLRNLDNSEGTE